MIEAIRGKGVNRAVARCDLCQREEVVTCGYIRGARPDTTEPNRDQVHQKLAAQGWALVKGNLHCPACEAARRARSGAKSHDEVADMTQAAQASVPREASREVKRQINDLLGGVYDTGRGRYQAGETDKTVAEAIGGGCLPAWVASVREEFYGPDGGNDDMSELAGEVRSSLGQVDGMLAEMRSLRDRIDARIKDLVDVRGSVSVFDKRLAAIAKAVGPKAGVR